MNFKVKSPPIQLQITKAVTRKTDEFISGNKVSARYKSPGFGLILSYPVFQNLPKFDNSNFKETIEGQ